MRSIWISRCAVRAVMMKPASTSTRLMIIRLKNVDVPARATRRNSTSMALNRTIDRMWSMSPRMPMRVALMTSTPSRMIANARMISSGVTVQAFPETRLMVVIVLVQRSSDIRNAIML